MTSTPSGAAIVFRRPVESDHPPLVRQVDHWFGGRRVRHLLGRMWFRHVASTSWLAEIDGVAVGFLIGFISPDRPAEALLHLVAVDPNQRRRGIGRALVSRFVDDAASRDAATVTAVAWPGEPPAVAFFEAIGFAAAGGPGAQRIHGTTAFPDYDGEGDDRIVFVREVGSIERP